MANYDYSLKITDLSSGTVTLTSSPFDVREYHSRIGSSESATVGEACEVRLEDGSPTNNLDEIRTLNRLLVQAEEAQKNRSLDKVYLLWKPSPSHDEYRSEVVQARAEWNRTTLVRPYWVEGSQFNTIYLERKNYWEGAEVQIPLTNPNGTANTAGLRIYNTNDGTVVDTSYNRYNYADIAGTTVLGDIAGATRLELINGYSTDLATLWIGHNYTDPDNFVHLFEAEDGSGGSVAYSVAASGGAYRKYSLSSGTTGTEIFRWDLTSDQITAGKGRYYHVLLRFFLFVNLSVRYQIVIYNGTTPIFTGPINSLDTYFAELIRDISTIQVAPWLTGLTGIKSLSLRLRAYQNTGSALDIDLDSLQLIPSDGWRYLWAIGGVAQNERVVDDGIDDLLYFDDGSGGDKVGSIINSGIPLMLKPGLKQRIYINMHSGTMNTAELSRYVVAKLFHRPRRITL
jgi:hypothetical protein